VSANSITRQQAEHFRRAKNEPSARRSLGGAALVIKCLSRGTNGSIGYASLVSKSMILDTVSYPQDIAPEKSPLRKARSMATSYPCRRKGSSESSDKSIGGKL
jgi:hypothetical protein